MALTHRHKHGLLPLRGQLSPWSREVLAVVTATAVAGDGTCQGIAHDNSRG